MPFCRQFAFLCAASLLLLALMQPAVAQQRAAIVSQGGAVEASFRSWLTSFEKSGAKIGQVASRYDAASDTLTVHGLSVSWPQANGASTEASFTELKVGDIALRSFKADEQGASFRSLLVDDLTLQSSGSQQQTFKIAKFTAENGKFPSLSTFVADPAKPFTTQIRLMRLLTGATLENAAAETIEVGNSLAAASASLEGLSGSKARLIQLNALQSRSAHNETGQVSNNATVDLLKVSNVDFDPYLRLFEASAYLDRGSARPWVSIIDALELNGLKIKNGSVVVDVKSALAGPLKLKQFNDNLTEIFDSAAVDPGFLAAHPESARKLATSVRDAFALDSLTSEEIIIAGQNQSGVVNATVAKAEIENFTANSISRIKANALKIEDATGQVALSAIDVGGINLVSIKPDAEKTSRIAVNDVAGETIIPTIASIGAQGLFLKLQGMSASIDQFDLAMAYFVAATPTNVKAKLSGLKFRVSDIAVSQIGQTLRDLGYADLDLSLNFSGFWDDSSSSVLVDDLSLVGENMGSLRVSGSLAGISREGLESPSSVLSQELAKAGLRDLRVTFENDTLFDRFIAKVADANGKSVVDIKKLLSSNLPSILSGITPADLRNKFVFAAIAFLNNPQVLVIGSTPKKPISLQEILAAARDPVQLTSLFDIEISASNRRK
jgi:hypothetical protein